jgi:hypothetical protein
MMQTNYGIDTQRSGEAEAATVTGWRLRLAILQLTVVARRDLTSDDYVVAAKATTAIKAASAMHI